MIALAASVIPVIDGLGLLLIVLCAAAVLRAILGTGPLRPSSARRPAPPWLDRERDLAASLGWRWRNWIAVRTVALCAGIGLGLISRIWVLVVIGAMLGTLGFRFALAGRAASRRLRMERRFLERLRDLRDRMAIGNQSLDSALQDIARHPDPELAYVLAPLAQGGSMVANVVEVGGRARSPVIEYACAVLLWSRSRSLDALISAIDELLLPVGEAQLAIQEEAAVTLTQQRAVTVAMAALMAVMLVVVLRVEAFRDYYRSLAGNVVLTAIVLMFALLVGLLSLIVRVSPWTRWDLRRLAVEQDRLNAQ